MSDPKKVEAKIFEYIESRKKEEVPPSMILMARESIPIQEIRSTEAYLKRIEM